MKETLKALTSNPLFIRLSQGNKKLKDSAKINFLIWSISAVITCPFRTALCSKSCYALKAERCYPSARKARKEHFKASRNSDFVDRMIYTISVELDRKKNIGKTTIFRIHESGDFYSKEYAEKWLEIMRHFENDKRILFVAYTKSLIYFDGVELPKNFRLLASVWADTTQANLDLIEKNEFRVYTAFKGEELEKALDTGYSLCRCKDCATCGKCWNNKVEKITCEIH